ncbi:MAG TPA: FGLLP motif-containing membrane protein [Cryptosporangiaceae bacterium]|nr:FGLLP motif-containing membrane protein [Cryptosporangiaceae bacterium]
MAGEGYPPECDTVYFFFNGARIGAARPDAAGRVSEQRVSVPGDASAGSHKVTSSCRASGRPVVHAAAFEVIDADLHRSALVTALPTSDDIDFSAEAMLASAAIVLGLVVLTAFPAELFNSTLEANYDEVRGWFHFRPRSATAGTGLRHIALFTSFLLLSGPLWFAMQSSSGLDAATILGALGLSLATAVVVLASDLPTFAYLRRRFNEGAQVVALPGTLIVAVACVLLSRAVHFEPGYFYGLVGGLAFSRQLRRDTGGRLAAASALILVVLSVVAWLAMTPVSRIADRPDAGLWPILAEGFLGGVFWVALDSLVLALLPLRLLAGEKVVAWSRTAWLLLYGLTLFAFVHILLRPGTGYVADPSRSPTTVVVGLFVAFAVFSVGFWAYFRYRTPRAAVDPAPGLIEA